MEEDIIGLLYLQNRQKLIRLQGLVDEYEKPDRFYPTVTNISNTWQLINLTYQNIVRELPLPKTLEEVRARVFDPTLYQTNVPFLQSVGFKFPVYTYVWRLDYDDPSKCTVVYHPMFDPGLTAGEINEIVGSGLPVANLTAITNAAKTRPYSYQVQFAQFFWPTPQFPKTSFFMTYMPDPEKPYNNDIESGDYNPMYIVGSGLLSR